MATYVKADAWVLQQIASTGLPLVGGSVSAYITGTTTPLAMYTDSAGSGSATSFTLNSLGMPQSAGGTAIDIYLDDSKIYKFIIRDSGGSAVGPTIDPVYPSGSSAIATFASMEDVRAGSANQNFIRATGFYSTGPAVDILLRKDGTGTQTASGATTISTAMKNDTLANAAGNIYKVVASNGRISDTAFGAIADSYSTECLTFRQNTIDWAGANKVEAVLSAGCLQTGQLTVNYVQRITDLAIRSAPTKVPLSHTGTALKFATNETPYYEGGWYSHFDGAIGSPTWGTLRSRTGVGLDVFGDTASGSSVQAQMLNVTFEGFGVGGQFAGCFNSCFRSVTFKRCDINYKLQNDTNNSVVFIACKANLSCSQHIIADGIDVGSGVTTTGATWINCEFEDADTFPHTHVQGGSTFQLDFKNCYTFENNVGTSAGSVFRVMQADVPGRLHMSNTPINATGKSDSILFYGRRNGSTVPWDIALDSCRLYSIRTTAGDEFDIDWAAGDAIHIMPSCFYSNTADADHTISSYSQHTLFQEGILYSVNTNRLSLFGFDSDVWLRASGNHLRFSNGDANNWEKGHFVFRQGTTDYHLFVDTSGNLRIKSGIPASATDGTVVGTQT